MSGADPDAPPSRERGRWTVRTWGDLEVGDVVAVQNRPKFITQISDHPIPVDIQAMIDETNRKRRDAGELDQFGKPVPELTILDVMDLYGWKEIVNDPRQIVVSCKTDPGDQRERQRSWRQPIHGRLPTYGFLVATGPDPHFDVCGRCGDLWPCAHTRMVSETRRVLDAEARKCGHCGQPVDNGQYKVQVSTVDRGGPREVLYHGRKGPCLNAALKLDPSVAEQRARYEAYSVAAFSRRATRGLGL